MSLFVDIVKRRGPFELRLRFNSAHTGVVALFGKSGSGKSTAVNLIAGLLTPDSGRIQLDDTPLFDSESNINVPTEQRHIGYVFQTPRLFPHYTVRGNLRYGMQRQRSSAPQFAFDHIVALLGLESLTERQPRELSGGEQQRVALGRALLSQPRLLLLDEPLAALDRARRNEVLPYLERVRDELGVAMVYVSHQFEEVLRLASHAVLMDQGAMLAEGELTQISLHPGLRQIIGADAMGAVLQARVAAIDTRSGLAALTIGTGVLNIAADGLRLNQEVRLQLLARDLILALEPPHGLSIRNHLHGSVTLITADDLHASMVQVDVGGVNLLVRITTAALRELNLQPGQSLWVLVKAMTLRGHVYQRSGL